MFGNEDQNQNSSLPAGRQVDQNSADAPAADVVATAPSAPTIPDPMVTPSTASPTSTNPTGTTQPDLSAEASAQAEVGINGVSMENAYIESAPQVGPAKASQPETVPTAASMITTPPAPAPADEDLASIKQQALQSLEPLVGQLDLAPEEKYKTVMMVVQASDKPKMLEEAYQAASQITDEKVRAQALLDIVNEVNYFTQQQAK